ncbi:MAG: hypothetical protein IJN02_07520 [Bacteroidales bacterium]|nr:hypothetical protein [Bacteroidales bacterium]
MVSVTNKQYFISSVRHSLSDMREIIFRDNLYVYIGDSLTCREEQDKNGKDYLILGDAYCSGEYCSVEDAVRDFCGSEINDLVYRWTGRWIIIAEDEIQIDACGLMQAFYGADNDGWFISSSLAVISKITKLHISGEVDNYGVNWQLLPLTLIDNVKSLFCTQRIKYAGLKMEVVPNLWVKDLTRLTTDEKVEILTGNLKTALSNIQKYSGRDIWIALTAGKDSRLVLAAAIDAKVKFQTYNSEHSSISRSDIHLPDKIASDYDFTHRHIRVKRKSTFKGREYLHFNGGNSKGADLEFYANGQHDCIPSNAIVIRGAIFEAGQRFGRTILSGNIDHFYLEYTKYYAQSFEHPKQRQALNMWIQNAIDCPIKFLDIRDRFYLEQRVGGWAASIEQSLGINRWNSLQLANNREILSVLLSASEEERNDTLLAYDSIRILEEGLLKYGVNEPHICDTVKYYIRKLLSFPKFFMYFKMKY